MENENKETPEGEMTQLLNEQISIYQESESVYKPRIIVLVGPTGVGKTTSIAKL